ncbi:phosphatidate cytidylyltransferase [Kordiimonas marina]|uniref:phosphatidate cytidylyltransferase n=1 Tax=Kordiimonas marina TaxID=2872312 RepID=UPI001FF19E12|nr:phosphatidate cytidylyltransferase [Kordiimonas marina]MCJ9428754.1 phosphatidate cytidylyltransferase [Kordiimonas marina]
MPLGMSDNLFQRVVSALLLLPPVLGAIYFGGWWFAALLMLGGALMVIEWCQLTRVQAVALKAAAATVIVAGVVWLMTAPDMNIAVVLASLGGLAAFGVLLLRLNISSRPGWWFAGIAYVALPIASLWWVRGMDAMLLFWIFLVVWATDVGGYFAGKGIGGPKLAPKISPKKTWAGLIGGMVLSVAASLVLHYGFGVGHNVVAFALWSALLPIWAQIGDLLESAVKRHFGVKDSGGLIPGHGGLLDRVDGLVFVAPAVVVIMLAHARMGWAL